MARVILGVTCNKRLAEVYGCIGWYDADKNERSYRIGNMHGGLWRLVFVHASLIRTRSDILYRI